MPNEATTKADKFYRDADKIYQLADRAARAGQHDEASYLYDRGDAVTNAAGAAEHGG